MDIKIQDFNPINQWIPDRHGSKWNHSNQPQHLIDQSTGRKYWNEPEGVVRFKSFLLTLGTPLVHIIAAIVSIVWQSLKLLSCYPLWTHKAPFEERAKEIGIDLLKLLTAPLTPVALEFSALYGIFVPYNGRKLYASFERWQFSSFVLAPCFQPDPQSHLLGGNPEKQGAF